MFSSLQPNRPKVNIPQAQSPLHHQQQIRPSSTYQSQDAFQPRNQMEAMPPHHSFVDQQASAPAPVPSHFNPAMVHPVFFSELWRKAPFPIPSAAAFSPVATGYAFGTARKDGSTKL